MSAAWRTLSCVCIVIICETPFGSPLAFDVALRELQFSCPLNPEGVIYQPTVLLRYHVEINCVEVSSIGVHGIT